MTARPGWRGPRARPLLYAVLAILLGGLAGWALDSHLALGGASRDELAQRGETLAAELAQARSEATELRRRGSELETQLAMGKGAEEALARQVSELAGENARLKEDVAFLQRLFADSDKPAGVTIPRLTLVREADDAWRYAVLVVRGGAATSDYSGALVLEATLAPDDATQGGTRALTLPADDPASRPNLALRFKYYQRVEGTLRVPPGSRVTALTARVYEDGSTTPRASRTLTNP